MKKQRRRQKRQQQQQQKEDTSMLALEMELLQRRQRADALRETLRHFSEINKDIATLNKKASSAAQVLTQMLSTTITTTTTTSLSSMDLRYARTIYLAELLQQKRHVWRPGGDNQRAGRPLSISLMHNKRQRCRRSATAIESIVGALRCIQGRRPVAVATA